MPRWEPDGRLRLVRAALELFSEQGYDETTVAQITERAGLTRSTFFRYFPEKRDVLTAGHETLRSLLAEGVAAAPASASVLEAVGAGLENAATALTSDMRDFGPRIQAVIAANKELQERAERKQVGLAATIRDALLARGVAESVAAVAAELGVIAFTQAHARWSTSAEAEELGPLARRCLLEVQEAAAALT